MNQNGLYRQVTKSTMLACRNMWYLQNRHKKLRICLSFQKPHRVISQFSLTFLWLFKMKQSKYFMNLLILVSNQKETETVHINAICSAENYFFDKKKCYDRDRIFPS